jgi:hypothetical protein
VGTKKKLPAQLRQQVHCNKTLPLMTLVALIFADMRKEIGSSVKSSVISGKVLLLVLDFSLA